ncbi:hypothetical protein F5Y10DRAFT_287696 [Nemania abortiva]|nr:hypothetical protein F5Y10DRAFT_287696 [Nemania abortiva]
MDIPPPTSTTSTPKTTSSSTNASTTNANTGNTAASTSGPAVNYPSDLSYSSGPSRTSTRNTSPDPASAGSLSRRSSPLVSLSVAADSIKYTLNTLSDRHTSMDKNSFQSVNDRRNKLTNERISGNQSQRAQQQQQQQQQVSQASRSSVQGSPSHFRSLVSSNWRAHGVEDATRTMYNQFDVTTNHHPQLSALHTTSFPNPHLDQRHHLQHAAGVTVYPNLGPISDAQLDSSFAYCYDRGNGQYTRLIPADLLPPLQNIPATQQSCAGMVVIPQPRGLPPNGPSGNTEPVVVRSPPVTPTLPADTIQSRIDNIVAATPPAPNHLSGHPGGGPGPSSSAPPGQRRPKIYCDKWVHEGLCAFTQQGCKYKHEMPSDRATQHQLGLFHGYPQWWKKHQADLVRQREAPPSEGPKGCAQGNDPKPSNERYLRSANSPGVGNGGTRGGGLGFTSDAGGQLPWRHGGEYGGEPQALGPPPPIGRATTSRVVGGTMRNPMATSSPGNNLSPYMVPYKSRFGPIAPPTRSNASATISNESVHGSPTVQPPMESHVTSQGTQRNSPVETRTATSMVPTSNPYASLDILGDNGDQKTNENATYGEAPRLGGAHLP